RGQPPSSRENPVKNPVPRRVESGKLTSHMRNLTPGGLPMSRSRLATVLAPLVGLFVLAWALPAARAQESAKQQPAAKGKLSALALSSRIDRYIGATWRREGVQGAKPADDYSFIRRVTLDLTGKIPTILEVTNFRDRAD